MDQPEPPWQEAHWDDIHYLLRYRVHEAHVDIDLYTVVDDHDGRWYESRDPRTRGSTQDIAKATALVHGYVKWDSCANLEIGDGGRWHICDKEQVTRLGTALERTHDLALSALGYGF